MSSLVEISSIHEQYKLRMPHMTQVIIHDDDFRKVNELLYLIRNILKSNLTHQNIAALDYEMRSFVYSLGTSLSKFNDMCTEEHLNYIYERLRTEYSDFIENRNIIDDLISVLNRIYERNFHSYEDGLKEILKYSSRKYSIISKRALSKKEKEQLKVKFNALSIEFKVYTDFLKEVRAYDIVIFIGSPNVFSETVIEHINGNHFYFLYYSCYYKPIKNVKWIDHERIHNFLQSRSEQVIEISASESASITRSDDVNLEIKNEFKDLLIEPVFPENLIPLLFAEVERDKDIADVSCKLIELENGELVFEDIGQKAKCDIMTADFIYQQKNVKDLHAGEYMILMDFNSWEDRKRLADKYFEKDEVLKYRKHLSKLKEFLKKKIENYGLEEYTQLLNRELDMTLKTYQISGLTRSDTFKLQNNQDFLKILRYISKTDEVAMKFYEAGTKLSSFHNRLGRIIRNELRTYFKDNENVLEDLTNETELLIPNIDALKIEIIKVKRVSDLTYLVPISRVGIPMRFQNKEVI